MRSNSPARMHVIKKEEKEANLKAFVQKDLDSRKAAGGEAAGTDYRVVARSLESPVARVMAAMAEEISESGIAVRMVLAQHGQADGNDVTCAGAQLAARGDTRIIRDIRLLDAHEQLVLSPTAAWIGDCMRREPSKRDAYECYSPDCRKTAGWAATSFERLWATGEPIELKPLPPAPASEPGDDIAVVPVGETPPTHEASTRH